ncbi:hypothetical protein A8B75_11680 [Sphingomonadales bacterium EhC05]|nr:hypothetical protein A8B75_11680 [Sphingomonadales bacterium EhC05]
MSSKIERQKGMQLAPMELNLLVECGAFETLTKAAADAHREIVEEIAQQRADLKAGRISHKENADKAMERLQTILGKDKS